jgi:hypothetical protein
MRPFPSPAARRRCTAIRNDGQPCRAWAVRGRQPPRCTAHADQGGEELPLALQPDAARDLTQIEQVIADLAERQAMLTEYIAAQVVGGADIGDVARLFALHGQNASRLGRLLRDQQALSGESAGVLLEAIGQALDELSAELGIQL